MDVRLSHTLGQIPAVPSETLARALTFGAGMGPPGRICDFRPRGYQEWEPVTGHCVRIASSSFALRMALDSTLGLEARGLFAILSLCLRAVSAPAAPVGLEVEDPRGEVCGGAAGGRGWGEGRCPASLTGSVGLWCLHVTL